MKKGLAPHSHINNLIPESKNSSDMLAVSFEVTFTYSTTDQVKRLKQNTTNISQEK